MKLPSEAEVTTEMAKELYRWDTREYFAVEPKHYWAMHYRNRLERILRAMADFLPAGGSILDMGCAQATASLLLAERGFRVTAVEANAESLEYARLRYESGEVSFICGDIMHLPLDEEFDAILLGEVLEHVPRPGALLTQCRDRLRQGGILVVTTPNGLSPHNWVIPRYQASSMELPERASIASGLGGRETHLFCFRPHQLRDLILQSGLSIERQELLNSYVINPIGLHRLLPLRLAEKIDRVFDRVPVFASFTTMTQFVIARKSTC